MTITASPLSLTRRNAAVSASAWFHTTDPGEFDVDYPDGITGPPTVTAAGTRVWTLDNSRGGEGAAFGGAAGNAWANYSNYAYFLKIDQLALSELIESNFINRAITLIASIPGTAGGYNGQNWALWFYNFNNTIVWITRRPGYKAALVAGAVPAQRYIYYAVKHDAATDKLRHITKANNGTIQEVASILDSVPASGQNYLLIKQCAELYILPVAQATDQKMIDWAQSGTAPSGYEEHFTFNEEGSVVYGEVSENSVAYPVKVDMLNYSTATIPGSTRRYTDAGFSSPLVEVPIVIAADCTAGLKNITLRRTRVGIPARTPALADSVLYDDGTIPVTVAVTAEAITIGPDVDCQVPSYPATFDLILSGNYDGAATVVSNNASLVPTSPVTIVNGVAVVACVASADVTGATVTATGPGGDTDACSVTVAEVPEEIIPIKIGPSQTLRSGVTSIYLHLTGEDGACAVTASPVVGLSGVPATVTIASGEADLTLTKMSAGTYTITATQGALTDTCAIVVPVGFAAATEYDLVQDIADMIETYGVGYHYDPELLTDTGGDLEDRMFTVRETDVVDGPMIGGKTVTIAVDAYYRNRAPSSDAKALIDYLNCEADAPSYVHALFATGGMVTDFEGAQKITYEIQVSLG